MTTTSIQAASHFRLAAGALTTLLLLAGGENTRADEAKDRAIVASLMAKDLTGIPGKLE